MWRNRREMRVTSVWLALVVLIVPAAVIAGLQVQGLQVHNYGFPGCGAAASSMLRPSFQITADVLPAFRQCHAGLKMWVFRGSIPLSP